VKRKWGVFIGRLESQITDYCNYKKSRLNYFDKLIQLLVVFMVEERLIFSLGITSQALNS
jgi:hypothetical protein